MNMLKLLFIRTFIYVLTFLATHATLIAQEQSSTTSSINNIIGKWEGAIILNENKSINILWRFEQSEQNNIVGFMGPASKGVATLPMSNLAITDSTLNFTIHSEGRYSGKITGDKITGTWIREGNSPFTHNMSRGLTEKHKKNKKTTDIHENIKLGNIDAVKAFLDKGNDIDKNYQGAPLLFHAIKNDRTGTIAKYLLNRGANANLELEGITPLMYAVAYQKHSIIKELIEHNAAINHITADKQSALIFAIKSRDKKIVKLLIDLGADPNLKIRDNYTAIDLAKEENIREILEALNIPYKGINDGPYVTKTEKQWNVTWISNNKKYQQQIKRKKNKTITHNGMKVTLWDDEPTEVNKLVYNGDFKIAAVSDIHGQYASFVNLLKNNGIVDNNEKWSFGKGHFVVTGDIFDRGSQVTQVLWFLYDLEKQAEKNGGKLHVLLGNHDVMVLNGNLRAVHPKYKETAKVLNTPLNMLYTEGSVLGDWLRTRPVLLKINGLLFTHGGLHPDLASKGLSIQQINNEFKKQLIVDELPEARSELGNYLHRGNGPIYYRGYFQGETATSEQIDQLLNHFKASNIIVGHTTHRQIEMRYDGKVIVIDANLKSGGAGEILLWESSEFTRGTLSGEKIALTQALNK